MKNIRSLILILIVLSCSNSEQKKSKVQPMQNFEKGTYGYDVKILGEKETPIELVNGNARVLLSAKYQGRVMTSSSDGETGKSYGWINQKLISSAEILPQFNPVGGEERFWLGPEGGQFSVFFPAGKSFDFENWITPACIDTEPFEVVSKNEKEAVFTQDIEIKNYSNFTFQFKVNRTINILDDSALKNAFEIQLSKQLKKVGYQSVNEIENTGELPWKKETGLLSVWLLGMFNPSPSVTIFVPYNTDIETDYIVKDDYFGKIPADRLTVENGMIYFKGDGKQRGKIGIPPQRALPVLGSYDEENKILTIVKTEITEGETDYVNSAWEMQKFPFKGDAINAYNDGPLENGSQLGPFYELESSSPALVLQSGEKKSFSQITVHFEGEEKDLNSVCKQIFNISLDEIKGAF